MMTERQTGILNRIVQEYIKTAQPVSSQSLKDKKGMEVSSATIRNDMQELSDSGYLFQPHTSSGRVPTDKGYRFFVDSLFEKEMKEMRVEMENHFKDALRFTHNLTRFMADRSSGLAVGYLSHEKISWKEGWERIFNEPEFQEKDTAVHFAQMLEDLERGIDELFFEDRPEIKVYIGGENPFSKTKDFGLIMTNCRFPKREKGFLVIAGPKRMAYDKNITLMDSIIKFLSNY
jgi:transcriptional regulator of heat shock response